MIIVTSTIYHSTLTKCYSDLKRFSGFGFRSKLQTNVDFPLNHLDMSEFASLTSGQFQSLSQVRGRHLLRLGYDKRINMTVKVISEFLLHEL